MVVSEYLPCRKDEQDKKTGALQSLQVPETWGKILHPQQLLLQSAGIKRSLELPDG